MAGGITKGAIPEAGSPGAGDPGTTSPDVGGRPAGSTRRAGRLVRALVERAGRRLWGLEVEGDAEIPATGPAIIAANHVSFFDSIVLLMAVPRPLSFVGKAEYMDSWTTRHVLPAMGMIPVDRASGFRAMHALDLAAAILRGNGLFAIYPEGTRSRDGRLQPGRTGVGHLAAATGAPVIPTGIIGTNDIQPPGARLPRPFRKVTVRFGRPIEAAAYEGTPRDRRRHITNDVMAAIGKLTGQSPARAAVA